MIAEVLTIGDELLRGEIVDSNKSFLSDRLLGLDIETHYHSSVRDVPAHMTDAFHRAAERADIVLVSGGLGPTRDDLTSQVLGESFGRKLVRDEAALATIRAFFESVGRGMAENNATQADFPEGAEVLPNPVGTALDGVKDATRDLTKGLDMSKFDPESETGKLSAERAEQARKIQDNAAKKAAERQTREAREALAKAEAAEAALTTDTPEPENGSDK